MPTTPVQALPYPSLSDPANGPVGFQNLALALEDYKTIIRCTSSTRPALVEGRVIYETDTDTLAVCDGAFWRVVSKASDSAVTYDPNVSEVFHGSRVYIRGRMATLAMECRPNINFEPAWALMSVPVGYRPPRRFWFTAAVVGNSTNTYAIRMDTDGQCFPEMQVPSGSNLIGSMTYPLP